VIFFLRVWRFVDPDHLLQFGCLGRFSDEVLRVSLIGGIEDSLALLPDQRGLVVVDHGRGHQAERGMAVLVVIPGEEAQAEAAGILDRAKAVREFRTVLQGAELAL